MSRGYLFAALLGWLSLSSMSGSPLLADVWWSLRPIVRPEAPPVKASGWVQNSLDAFVLARLEAEGLEPAPPADRATLLRRATLDLLGLPPSVEELEAFLADPSPDAFEKVVDRLLASPRYGERWGRHWLDLARFSESHGFEYDRIRDHAYPYRDYVIKSLNEDKPYPRFVAEQIAGDVLEPVTPEGIAATGFLVAGPWDEAGSLQQSVVMRSRAREEELEDVISAVSQTFLGMTVNCARCHDHKFDPIPQRDYYRLKAVFCGVRRGDRPLLTPAESRTRLEEISRLKAEISRASARIAELDSAARQAVLERRPRAELLPAPLVRFSFRAGAAAGPHPTLAGGARIAGGRLILRDKGAHLSSEPLEREVREKTLEACVALSNLDQRGGGVISLETVGGQVFDALVFGEREPRKWLPGSDTYSRSRDLAAPLEACGPGELVHLAITYGAGGRIAAYRNGEPYGEPYQPAVPPAVFPAGRSHLLLGLRHTGAGNGFLEGEIEEARLYDRALSPEEVRASFRAGAASVSREEVRREMGESERGERERLEGDLQRARAALGGLESVPLVYAANPEDPPPTRVLLRGDVEKPGEPVTPGGLSAVVSPPADLSLPGDAPEGLRRVRFAEWVASPENPLTPRVLVNRIWHHHFGKGIVATPSDFGQNGDRPSHPELLDWLASEFLRGGSRLKGLHRLILLSSAYRQSGTFSEKAAAVDAQDRLLWRHAPRRLEAEAIRDSMLAVSGELNLAMGGAGFRPFTVKFFNSSLYTVTDPEGPEFNRRSVYRHAVNSAKDPLLEALDCPDPSTKTPSRTTTTTPLQSLELMNSSFVLRQSRRFAERLEREAGPDLRARVERAYLLAYSRRPSPEEAERAVALAREEDLAAVTWAIFNSSEFGYLR